MPPRRRIVPIVRAPSRDAFEREFGDRTVSTSTQTPAGTYCGSKPGIPLGSPSFCYNKGKRVGFAVAMQQGQKKVKSAILKSSAETRKLLIAKIQNKGLAALKRELHIGDLRKDELRSIVTKYTGTRNALANYSSRSQQELLQHLLDLGWQR